VCKAPVTAEIARKWASAGRDLFNPVRILSG